MFGRLRDSRPRPPMPPPPAPGLADVDALVAALARAKAVDADRARAALAEFRIEHPAGDPDAAVAHLVREGVLTAFQADRARAGEADKLQLGPYLLLEPLGQGNLGAVFHALHRGSRERYAVKVLPLRNLWKVVEARKVADRIAGLPRHPALVPLADVNTAAGSHYLAWPFVAGETLESVVWAVGPMAAGDAARIMAEVADGLAVCHAGGVVHGLVKPSNVMLGSDRRPRLLDLGVGAILAENTDDDSMIDTISTANAALDMMDYAPPELHHDPAARTPAGDVYAFGCSLHLLLVGSPPFPDGNVVDKMLAHQAKPPPAVAGLDDALAGLLARTLAKDPAERPTAAEVRDRLRAVAPADDGKTPNRLSVAMAKIAATLAAHASGGRDSSGNLSVPNGFPGVARPAPASDGMIDFNDTLAGILSDGPETPPTPVSSRFRGTPPPATASPAGPAPRKIALANVAAATPAPQAQASQTSSRSKKMAFDLPPTPIGLEGQTSAGASATSLPPVVLPEPPRIEAPGGLARLAFWRAKRGLVQLSVFGPAVIDPGQRVTFAVYAHPPESFASARTLCRAMRADSELVGAGFVEQAIPKGTDLAITMALSNAGLAQSETRIHWIGQLQPRTYEVFVPWECPAGLMTGVVSAAVNGAMAGSVPIRCLIRPRSS